MLAQIRHGNTKARKHGSFKINVSVFQRFRVAVILLLVSGLLPLVAEATRADLAKARSLYNKRQFDEAIQAATAARRTDITADAAAIVLARAHLERYRERAD